MPIDCDDKLLSDLSSPPVLFPPFAQSHPIGFVRSTVADNLLNSNDRRVSAFKWPFESSHTSES
jgi:hypothetical protein